MTGRPVVRRAGALVTLALLVLTSCGSGASSERSARHPTASGQGTPSTGVTAPARPTPGSCGNQDGGFCLGLLPAGTYHTGALTPRLTYTVPAGWSNDEDLAGNFLLVPPGGDLAGVNAATSDFIGVYSRVLAHANRCASTAAPGVGTTPRAIMTWLTHDPAVRATATHGVQIGGLRGQVTTLRMAPDWHLICPYSNGAPVAPLMIGAYPSDFDHNLVPGQATRLYLLSRGAHAVAIEVVDVHDAGTLAASCRVVDRFRFGG